jgi:hypothetical protein
MRASTCLSVVLLALSLALPRAAAAQESDDPDVALSTRYFAMHLGSNVATGVFGTASLVAGVQQFSLLRTGDQNAFFLGLTLTSMGVASLVSAGTGADGNVRVWQAMRRNFEDGSDAERRLFREAEATRLRRMAVNRGIGLAADGTFLGLGIFLLVLTDPAQSALGVPLVLNGGFLLGLDIFRLIVDDQTANEWIRRNRDADEGYFTARRPKPRVLGAGVTPMWDGRDMGAGLTVVGVF